MKKVLGFIKRNSKTVVTSMMVAMLSVFSSISCFALDEEVATAYSAAIETMASDVTKLLLLAIPAGLGVVGLVLAIKSGIKFVKGLIGRS